VCGFDFFNTQWLGDGEKNVRELFRHARTHAPAIIFIDEIDAIATRRHDSGHGIDRAIQRILMQLLVEMDGFDQHDNVRCIFATNRPDTLDPALLRPGRLDRKIEFPEPDRRARRMVYQVCTATMNLHETIDLEDYVQRPEKVSCADIQAICQAAGMNAVRRNRYVILPADMDSAYTATITKPGESFHFYS
jgi:26S proteasome regulatory subunit T3